MFHNLYWSYIFFTRNMHLIIVSAWHCLDRSKLENGIWFFFLILHRYYDPESQNFTRHSLLFKIIRIICLGICQKVTRRKFPITNFSSSLLLWWSLGPHWGSQLYFLFESQVGETFGFIPVFHDPHNSESEVRLQEFGEQCESRTQLRCHFKAKFSFFI